MLPRIGLAIVIVFATWCAALGGFPGSGTPKPISGGLPPPPSGPVFLLNAAFSAITLSASHIATAVAKINTGAFTPGNGHVTVSLGSGNAAIVTTYNKTYIGAAFNGSGSCAPGSGNCPWDYGSASPITQVTCNGGPTCTTISGNVGSDTIAFSPNGSAPLMLSYEMPANKAIGAETPTAASQVTPNSNFAASNYVSYYLVSAPSFTAHIAGTTLTVTKLPAAGSVIGNIEVGDIITGSGVTSGTTVTGLGTGTGGLGTYTVNHSQTVAAETMAAAGDRQEAAAATKSIGYTTCATPCVYGAYRVDGTP